MASPERFIPVGKPSVSQGELDAVADVIRSGWWTTGPKVTEFEENVCSYLGQGLHAVGLNSCTGGLFLSLLAHGIGAGDEVIVPTWTFVATSHVVEWTGARVVLCDVEPGTLNIDVAHARSLVTERTKAVMPVHFAGYPCDMAGLRSLADEYGLAIIEDAAHAIGARHDGVSIGDHGFTTVFSFYVTKNLACGEGGMVVSRDQDLVEKVRKLGYFGVNKKAFERYTSRGSWFYEVEELGYKYNMDNIHAALGLAQLSRLEEMNDRRREIAARYRAGLKLAEPLADDPRHHHIYHLFPVLLPEEMDRDDVFLRLRDQGIGTSVHFIPLHLHPYYQRLDKGQLPVATAAFRRALSLPMYPGLTDEDQEYVIETLNEILEAGS